jgi:hypothetical protein
MIITSTSTPRLTPLHSAVAGDGADHVAVVRWLLK